MDSSPLVYIIVLNYRSIEDCLACVQSVNALNYDNYRLLVIDNDSRDGSGEVLERRLPGNQLIRLSKNIGYAGGNNVGLKIALENNADYVFVVNPDVRLPKNCLTAYVEVFEDFPHIGVLNPVQLDSDAGDIDAKFNQSVFRNKSRIKGQSGVSHGDTLFEAPTLLGAAIMFSVRAVRVVGGFDPLYFAYGEEEDFCRRFRHHGFTLAVTTKEPVVHLRSKEKSTVSDFVLFLRLKGAYLYCLKDFERSFWQVTKLTIKNLWLDISGQRKDKYPFSMYDVRLRHVVKTMLWILINYRSIAVHRRKEKAGCAHL